jgi:sulfite dehydrogenase
MLSTDEGSIVKGDTMGEQRRGRTTLGIATLALTLALAAAGCGGDADGGSTGTGADRAAVTHVRADRYAYARGVFNELCAGCHTLADAGARGQRYNLDRSPGLSAAQVWNAIQNGEPGMPAWKDVLSDRELSALAIYITNVAKRSTAQEEGWSRQITRRIAGGSKRWNRIAESIDRQLEREGRKYEDSKGRVVPPKEDTEG